MPWHYQSGSNPNQTQRPEKARGRLKPPSLAPAHPAVRRVRRTRFVLIAVFTRAGSSIRDGARSGKSSVF